MKKSLKKMNTKRGVAVFLYLALFSTILQAQEDDKKSFFGIGLNGGATVGDFENSYSSNVGIDLIYLHKLSNRFYIGGSTGFANYFGDTLSAEGFEDVALDDLQFLPLAASFRISPVKNLLGGVDIGYAFGLNDGNDGGFYASPRITYLIDEKWPVFAGYRLIGFEDENLGAIQFGIGFIF